MYRMDVERNTQRHNQRHDHDNRREDLHEATNQDQEDVQRQQKHHAGLDVRASELDQVHWHLRTHQPVGQSDSHAENDQDPAHETHALREHSKQITADGHVSVNDRLREECVRGGERRRFH